MRLGWCVMMIASIALWGMSGCADTTEDDCGRSICGCSSKVEREVKVHVTDASMQAIEGVTVRCADGSDTSVMTDAGGIATHSGTYQLQTGCGWVSCEALLVSDSMGRYADQEVRVPRLDWARVDVTLQAMSGADMGGADMGGDM